MSSVNSRRSVRRQLRAQRAALPVSIRLRAQRHAHARLARLPCFRRARHIASYHAIGAEIDPAGLVRLPGQRFYLPIIIGKTMHFAADDAPRTARGPFGIAEPIQSRRSHSRQLDLVIVPLVGFDADCNRMGMGGGFYDRCFAYRRSRKHVGPRLVGLAFDCQQTTRLPVATWDVPLDLIVTPTRIHQRIS